MSVVIRGDISDGDGKCVRADAVCKTPFAADDQKAAVDEVAAALRMLRRDRAPAALPRATYELSGPDALTGASLEMPRTRFW